MESASWLDVVLNRLRFLTRPLPLASAVGVLLLGVFVWDYLSHPEWFGAFEEESTGPNEDIDLSGLTPEEQAAVAGIDNLTLLFNELGVESGNIPPVQAIAEDTDEEQNAFLSETLALSQPNSASSGLSDSPFTSYLQQYQFGKSSSPSSVPSNSSRTTFGGINFNYFGRANTAESTAATRSNNPLTNALLNQAGLTGAVQSEENSPLANELRSQLTADQAARENAAENDAQQTLPPGQFNSQIVTIPGVDFPVLPTLPQMSPPPGTTGYTAPASLELMPPLPGRSGSSSSAFPATAAPIPGSGVPNLSSGSAVPPINSNVDVGNGYVTPYTPVVPNPATTPSAVTQPFTAPRPPGSYTGGGYINTFSNPNGPSN